MTHPQFLGKKKETWNLSQVRHKGLGTAQPWLTGPGCQFLPSSPWHWSSGSSATPGAPHQEKQSLPGEQGSPGIVAQAGQTSSETQRPCLPQTNHSFSRQVSLSPHSNLLCGSKSERGEAGETGRLQPEKNREQRSVIKWEVTCLNFHCRAPNTKNLLCHQINMKGSGGFLFLDGAENCWFSWKEP